MTRTARLIVTITAALGALLVGPSAQASKQAEGSRHAVKTSDAWVRPPSNLETFSNIYGSRRDGFIADHDDEDSGIRVNTIYPQRKVIVRQYCVNIAERNDIAPTECQTEWSAFYTWLRENRDGTKADWIEMQQG